MVSRRPIWLAALTTIALASCAPNDGSTLRDGAGGAAPDIAFPRVEELADGVYSYAQLHVAAGETITTLSLFVVTPDGVLVADGQESVEETQRLIDTIAGITDQPITHMVICSDHGDHSAGNSAFPSDAVFFAHPTSAVALAAQGTDLVEAERVIEFGGREIRILHLGRSHTGGDLVVYVPDAKVLFMSETFLDGVFPAMRSAYPSEWVAVIEAAQAMDVDIYVPGHGTADEGGRPRVAADLHAYRQALAAVIAEATRLHASGLTVEEAVSEADFGGLERLALSASQIPRAIERVYMELDGELPR